MNLVNALRRFLLIGGVGFLVDALLLTLLTGLAAWTPWQARALSFPSAVLVTWWLNRTYTFAGRGMQRRSVEAVLYFGIQTGGALLNLAVFGACLAYLPQLRHIPAIPLAIGAVAGLAFNFAISNFALYSQRRAYPGTEP